MKIRVPSFLTKHDQELKQELMLEFKRWKTNKVTNELRDFLEGELTKLITEDEKDNFSTLFQTKWQRAKRLGKREQLRNLLKDLQ